MSVVAGFSTGVLLGECKMSSKSSAMLFSPEGALLRDPSEIDRALAEMWQVEGAEGREHTERKIATRASVANLVVIAEERDWNGVEETLAELSNDYPTRTIVLLIDEAETHGDIRASVSAICRVPQDGAPDVCCEQIIVRSGSQHVDEFDRTLLPLLESDVPVLCWWRVKSSAWPKLFNAVRELARRIIVDGSGFIEDLPHLRSTPHCAIRDMGWYRTSGLRELVAQMFDGAHPEVVHSIERIDIDTGGCSMGEVSGLWLTAFLAGQLGWVPTEADATAEDQTKTDATLHFQSNERAVIVRISHQAHAGSQFQRITIRSGEDTFNLEHHAAGSDEYRLITCTKDVCQAPRSVQVRCLKPSEALSAALVGRPIDRAYERAHATIVALRDKMRKR
jgi:glucose-6-phosphate dehydrogenase assembly protein OpcA